MEEEKIDIELEAKVIVCKKHNYAYYSIWFSPFFSRNLKTFYNSQCSECCMEVYRSLYLHHRELYRHLYLNDVTWFRNEIDNAILNAFFAN